MHDSCSAYTQREGGKTAQAGGEGGGDARETKANGDRRRKSKRSTMIGETAEIGVIITAPVAKPCAASAERYAG